MRNDAARRAVALADAAVVESERRSLASEMERRETERRRRLQLEEEARGLEKETRPFAPDLLASLDALRGTRGARPEALPMTRLLVAALITDNNSHFGSAHKLQHSGQASPNVADERPRSGVSARSNSRAKRAPLALYPSRPAPSFC